MIHNPNRVGPMDDHPFGLVLDHCFHDSNTQNFGCGWWKMKIGFWGFQFLRIEFQWHFCKIKQRMGLTRMTCPITKRLSPKISLPFLLQPILLSVSSPSSFFFIYLELSLLIDPSLLLHKPPPPHQSSPLRATTRSSLRSLSFSLSLSSFLPDRHHHEQPPWATASSTQIRPLFFFFFFSLSLSSLCRSVSLSVIFSLFHPFFQISSSLCLILWFGSPI